MSTTAGLPDSIEGVQIIGIDCAAQPKDFGLARGNIRNRRLEIDEFTKLEPTDNCFDRLSKRVGDWIAGDDLTDRPTRTLLALDAPLGWPIHMTSALQNHQAGTPLGRRSDERGDEANPGNRLFRRHTDRFIAAKFPGAPLDIGADRIARVARSALELLGRVGDTADGRSAPPLLWNPEYLKRLGAIEVYPRLTLLKCDAEARKFSYKGTKPEHAKDRREIVELLRETKRLELNPDTLPRKETKTGDLDYDHDSIDAVLCALEGLHFLLGESVGPKHDKAASWLTKRLDSVPEMSATDIATREGWIWFHQDLLKG